MPLIEIGYGCVVFSSFPTIGKFLNIHTSVIRDGNPRAVFDSLLVRSRMSSVITRPISKGMSWEIAYT